MSDLVSFLFVAQTATLVIASALVAYPVVAYARNVAYTRGLALLSASLFVLTATYVVTFFYHRPVVSGALDLLGALLAALGTWEFAEPFVRVGGDGLDATAADGSTATEQSAGGFEGARDD
ncbi:hypothetical protein [Halorussus halobius]|uniref:hypothetical protein n=1 Tax=Halorussus halobius TaxID=1710537 RepID=UPI001092989E|nr:hypothetical protein [Halorussus halobius]